MGPEVNVLDLFSGLEGWSAPFREHGHEVVTLDLDPRFRADHQVDFLTVDSLGSLERSGRFDVILASPPCDTFSTGSFRHHWIADTSCVRCGVTMSRMSGERWDHPGNGHVPLPEKPYAFTARTQAARVGRALMHHTLALIDDYEPTLWLMENPRAMMRNLVPPQYVRETVTWCQYGDMVMKPTDLWGNLLLTRFDVRSCKNGDPCHEAAPRGAKTGTQGKKDAAARGKIPYGLALEVCLAAESLMTNSTERTT